MTQVRVIVQLERLCGADGCWCEHVGTDKTGKRALPLKAREVELSQVGEAIADVELFGFRGHPATAWVDNTVDAQTAARRNSRRFEPGAFVPDRFRNVRASDKSWRGEFGGSRFERLVVERTPITGKHGRIIA